MDLKNISKKVDKKGFQDLLPPPPPIDDREDGEGEGPVSSQGYKLIPEQMKPKLKRRLCRDGRICDVSFYEGNALCRHLHDYRECPKKFWFKVQYYED